MWQDCARSILSNMQAQVIDNVTRHMASELIPQIESSVDSRMAVAFVSRRGLGMLEPAIRNALSSGGTVEFLVGLDMRTTEPQALEVLLDWSHASSQVAAYCYSSVSTAIYHRKLYLFRKADSVSCVIGSSNLTEGGLKRNVEINVLLDGSEDEEVFSDMFAVYSRLKFDDRRVELNADLAAMYGDLCKQERKRDAEASSALRKDIEVFEEAVRTMRRPQRTRHDLFGWLDAVYDSLPVGEFTNEAAYRAEGELQRKFPHNLNVRAKIRQQLQVLRDLGFVQHLSPGRWRKL